MLTSAEVVERIENLRRVNLQPRAARTRIRAIMNGGAGAITALLGPNTKLKGDDLPVANMLDAGLSRLAQRIGKAPDVKVDPRVDRDSNRERSRSAKRQRIVNSYDHNDKLAMQLPQVGRWLPGYGFVVWLLKGTKIRDAEYPQTVLRDPYDCYPGVWGPNQQPDDLAIIRQVDANWLANRYPKFKSAYSRYMAAREKANSQIVPTSNLNGETWEGHAGDVEVAEYFDSTGSYLIAPAVGVMLEAVENPLSSGPSFVVVKRFAFDQLVSQYQHVIGLMGMMAKFNILSEIATTDSVFKETNIVGEMVSKKYSRGRFAVNFFEPGTRIEKPTGDIAYQTFQQIDRIERQLRIGANYSTMMDAQSPNSFVTGQGLDRLGQGVDANVTEYQLALQHGLELLDAKRLEWDEVCYPNIRKPLVANVRGVQYSETYEPASDIHGNYTTRRVYGVMAGWDEPQKIVTGLQLLQGKIIDRQTFQENLSGLGNVELVNERILKDTAEQGLMEMLGQKALQGDPAATMALVEINRNPKDSEKILAKFFTPEEPQVSPEQQALMAQAQAGGQPGAAGGAPGGVPPDVATVLSRLEQSGNVAGGVQTVGQLPGR